ncbi:ribbon-helix-helix protein, CopG family [Cryobacterium sp. TMT1-3]|uniref:Ribbon-helix-helix protein, CopG family n=1 Tax=Cryobacterium luteum TaxID=1424661 RepID=A0A1H8AYD8_9MICO|nr:MULTISPECIES: ribbon-helix-helix protein, CopG family [Cryobacterium]TFB88674.1 ribbon-helix-helix protein, CopG family [Cryobacterium luteum]TFC24679.1 ribbon-helix-helix protein, CopG family [Cryobacterium sp. TMT1-3]SEM75516.1 Ribbon-helix-helix protein, copG family [Cryobacterium luteum]
MAMTVRLPQELDSALEAIARQRHISKHAALVEAADRFVRQESKTERVLASVDETTRDYAELLQKLEDT